MTDETPRRGSAVWAMLLTVVVACSACAVYRWYVPRSVEARAIVQVPAATDLGTDCQRADLLDAAFRHLEVEGAEFLLLEVLPLHPQLSGKISARKIPAAISAAATGKTPSPTQPRSPARKAMETWELTYRTSKSDRVVPELAALIAVLKQRIVSATEVDGTGPRQHVAASRIDELEDKLLDTELTLETLADTEQSGSPAPEVATQQQRTETLQQELDQAREEYARRTEDWKLLEREFRDSRQLAVAASNIPAGSVQEAVRQLDRHHQLSQELTRLNQAEERLSAIYGDRHPKLMEVRAKFEELLTELGGWEEIVDDAHLAKTLQTAVQAILTQQSETVADLELGLELELEQLTSANQQTQQQSALTSQQETLRQELATARESQRQATASIVPAFVLTQPPTLVELPWFLHTGVLYGLTTLCGLAAGSLIHRSFSANAAVKEADAELPLIPAFQTVPVAQLDLAQRRAMRQARLKQIYA